MKGIHLFKSKTFLVGFISFAVLIGSSYNTYLSYERFYNPDTETYINIARGNFAHQSLIRRYRVIVPMLANLLSLPVARVYYKIVQDKRNLYDWPLLTGFFLVNCFLMSLAAICIFKIMEFQQLADTSKVLGLAAFLCGGRWATLVAAHPITDSLTILCIAAMIVGLLTHRRLLLCTAIVVGMLSKESFALFFPLALFFCGKALRTPVFISMVFAVGLYLGVKFWIDALSVTPVSASVNLVLDTFNNILYSFRKLLSVKGVADIFSVYGFFSLVFLSGACLKAFRQQLWPAIDNFFLLFSAVILLHMLLSTELARMFFLGSALFVPFLARCMEIHPWFAALRANNGKITS